MAAPLRLELYSEEALGVMNALGYFALAVSADECHTLTGVDQSVIAGLHARIKRLYEAERRADSNG